VSRAPTLAITAIAVALVSTAACTGTNASSGPAMSVSSGAAAGSGATAAARWWSNSAAAAGSTIDPARPSAAAAKLSRSRTQYCQMLTQTLQSGRSVLAGVGAQDPARSTATIAFVAELQRVAPAEVSTAWDTLAPALVRLVKPATTPPTADAADAAKTASAAKTIADDAKAHCNLDLSRSSSSK
jgi:hypothetical protein